MDCRSAFERLSADIDDELSPAEGGAVRDHLRTCDRCARSRAVLAQTREAFRSIAPDRVRPVPRRPAHSIRTALGLAATVAVVAVGGAVLWNDGRTDPSEGRLGRVGESVQAAAGPSPAGSATAIGLAADCLRPRAVDCRVDVPCADMRCAPSVLTAADVMPSDR